MSRKRARIPMAIAPRRSTQRYDMVWNFNNLQNGTPVTLILFTVPPGIAGLISIKSIRVNVRGSDGFTSTVFDPSFKFAILMTLDNMPVSPTLTLVGSNTAAVLTNTQNTALWTHYGGGNHVLNSTPGSTDKWFMSGQQQDVNVEFKKLRRRVKAGDILHVTGASDIAGINGASMNGICTFYFSQ